MDGPLEGVLNMARDHALALSVEPGRGALRLYRWARPTLSFGRNEPARETYDRGALERSAVAAVRRPTGGRAVLHHREVTYAVAVPLRALGGPREAYRRVSRALVRGLRLLGVEARVPRDGVVVGPDAGPCFRTPAPGEVTVEGRKLVGSAQARIGDSLLQHGSVLLADDQAAVSGFLRVLPPEADAPATLGALLGGTPRVDDVMEALLEGFRRGLGGRWPAPAGPASSGGPETADEARLLRRYRSGEWTWRR